MMLYSENNKKIKIILLNICILMVFKNFSINFNENGAYNFGFFFGLLLRAYVVYLITKFFLNKYLKIII